MERISLLDVCKQILRLQRVVCSELSRTKEINQDTGTLLADLRDYALYRMLHVLECESEKGE
jgi:hypothetical protein